MTIHNIGGKLLQCLLLLALAIAPLSNAQAAARDEVILYVNDHAGSAVAAFDANGDLCWNETYTPYGHKTEREDSFQRIGCGLIAEERGFTGHTEDSETDLVYMQQRYYDPTTGRFLSTDPVGPMVGDPRTINRYSYAANNPYKYSDPTGEFFTPETIWDLANVGMGFVSFGTNMSSGNFVGAAVDAAGIIVDVVAAVVPGAPGGAGTITKSVRAAGDVTKNGARGRASEARVLDDLGVPKNTKKVSTAEGNSIPDSLTSRKSVEIKDCISVSCTRQIRIQTGAAQASGRESVLVTGTKTQVSKPAERAFDRIIRRDDLGPQ